jgi:3-hydroxyacyl-CoA dehydrogenase
MLETPDLFKHALEGRLTPQQIDEAFEKGYGVPGMSRFFNRGT